MRFFLKMQIISAFGTQRRFARICNKTDDWLSKIVLGVRSPNKKERELICSKLGVKNEDYIFFDPEDRKIEK